MNEAEKKHILFIYEGVSAEDKLLANVQEVYLADFSKVEILNLPADGNIYMLWRRLVEDEFETNVIDLLREMSTEARERLESKGLKASQFSEIYMFFDYDGHAAQFSEETIEQANELCKSLGMEEIKNKRDLLERLLLVFDNETEQGKLYISYPMIESIKEIRVEEKTYNRLYIPLEEISKYKHSFEQKTDYGNYSKITRDMWAIACIASVKQASLIVKSHEACTYEQFIGEITQLDIYHAEKRNYINNPNGYFLAVLNSIPLFLCEYFDKSFWNEEICGVRNTEEK